MEGKLSRKLEKLLGDDRNHDQLSAHPDQHKRRGGEVRKLFTSNT